MIRLQDLDVHWTGIDSTTPEGHCLALGTDTLGVIRLCLYRGDTPRDDNLRGSLLIPPANHQETFLPTATAAYGPRGAWVTSSGDHASMLARLAGLEG